MRLERILAAAEPGHHFAQDAQRLFEQGHGLRRLMDRQISTAAVAQSCSQGSAAAPSRSAASPGFASSSDEIEVGLEDRTIDPIGEDRKESLDQLARVANCDTPR